MVSRMDDGSVKTTVHRKATHTDSYLNFDSHHSAQHKESVVRSLVRREEQLITNDSDRVVEADHVNRVLRANNYPKRFIQATRRKVRNREARPRDQRDDKPLVVIPYVKGVTEKVTRALKPYARVAAKPDRNLRGILVKPKDRRGPHQNAGLVYQYECECDQVYIGETGRSIKTREKNTNGLLETWTKIIPVFQNTS